MDAVDYLKAYDEVCTSHEQCFKCPLGEPNNGHHVKCQALQSLWPDEAVYIVEQWLKDHPDTDTILQLIQKRFKDEEQQASGKPSGLKEPAVWNKARSILEEYMPDWRLP